ncbi:hypothetical protein SCUCBS95973_008609 [Sporothrix curviconia]|uniref:Zn(2)-C6 fungal-type domain-containing protein n=1 Tax=Sporothrix curviconia TaxID=1260050 RepID=A0ABP0CMX5_9PEZI
METSGPGQAGQAQAQEVHAEPVNAPCHQSPESPQTSQAQRPQQTPQTQQQQIPQTEQVPQNGKRVFSSGSVRKPTPGKGPGRKPRACAECKKQKMKCEVLPGKLRCRHCSRRDLACVMHKSVQREIQRTLVLSATPSTAASEKDDLDNLRREIQQLKASMASLTTAQLECLTEKSGDKLTAVVLKVGDLLSGDDASRKAISDALVVASSEIARGQDVLVMTSYDLVVGADEAASLDIYATVARALVAFLSSLATQPAYVVAKGGITSSDMATKAFGFRRARVVGQAAHGVPLWRCDEPTAKWPGLPYVVFPGNVGSNEALYEVVNGWR